ncbi:MAG: SulP family inorganic anion transporter [Verrucomicrobia bacterium]|nr:SulP family inorganic anion transporter [Verrucomicrobiota bacterium]
MKLMVNYRWTTVRKDILAGVTVAAISLPQAMAYALIAGVDPRFGLYSAIVVTLVASIFGSSSHLINGPTNAISLVVFSALAFLDPDARFDAYQATFLLCIMVGIVQILIAVFRLGDLTRYISESVVLGFMAGASCLIALGQLGNLLGVKDQGSGHQHVLVRVWLTLTQGGPLNLYALGISLGTIVLVIALGRWRKAYRLPQMEMLLTLIGVALLSGLLSWSIPGPNGKTLIAVIGNVPAGLPAPHIPTIKFWWVKELSSSALAIAFLGLLEALAIAKSIAKQTRQSLDYNRQCLAEGLANLTGGFFQCLPGSGSLTRSAINFQSGAVTRVSGVFAAATVAVVLLSLAPLARYVPKAALAGLLLVTAVKLVDWRRLRLALRASGYDAGLILITAFSALFISVEFSILIGVALSIVLFVPRAARLRCSELVVTSEGVVRERLAEDPNCDALILYDLEGEMFFGAAPELDRYFNELKQKSLSKAIHVIVVRLKRTRNPDMVCLERLEYFIEDLKAEGITVLLCGVRPDLAKAMKNMGFSNWLRPGQVFLEEDDKDSSTIKAVRQAYGLLEVNNCAHCKQKGLQDTGETKLYYLV